MAFINFVKGAKAKYSQETYPNSVYFAEDTQELLFMGQAYGFPNNLKAVKSVEVNTTGLMTVTFVNGGEPYTVQLTKAMVGLGNVDNTSDADKPVSSATSQAINNLKNTIDNYTINGKKISTNPSLAKGDVGLGNVDDVKQIPMSMKGQPNGVAELDENGKVPASQLNGQLAHVFGVDGVGTSTALPSSGVKEGDIYWTTDNKKFYNYNGTSWDEPMDPKDDTIYNFRNCDVTGDTGRTNILYRWDGQALVEISESVALGETNGTAYEGSKGKANRDALNALPGTAVISMGEIGYEATKVNIPHTYVSKDSNNKYGSGQEAVKSINAATKTQAGVMSATDKTFVDGIRDGNLALPTPVIEGTWTFYKNDGTQVDRTAISPVPDANNPTLENGYKASFSGTYKWTHEDSKKDPTQVQSGSNWTDLPASGTSSKNYTSAQLTSNTTIKIGIQAAKTGLMVSGSNVVPASGMDTTTAQRTVSFNTRRYFGVTTSEDINETTIKALTNELGGKGVTKSGISATTSQYYIFAYPKSLGTLSTIIQDGATPVLGAFTRSELTITNAAGLAVELYVYRSNNKGAFTNAQLQFS